MSVSVKESKNELNFEDDRGAKKRTYLKNEKWIRQIKMGYPENQQVWKENCPTKDASNDIYGENENSKKEKIKVRKNSREFTNSISNPKKIPQVRSRTESPPPKSKRTDKGINRGKPGGCSICRPKIHKRMHQVAGIRSDIRKLSNDHSDSDDNYDGLDSE